MIHLLMQVRQNDLWEDGSSSDVKPESQNTGTQDNTRNTKIGKILCIKRKLDK
jgi:hypothetical protein